MDSKNCGPACLRLLSGLMATIFDRQSRLPIQTLVKRARCTIALKRQDSLWRRSWLGGWLLELTCFRDDRFDACAGAGSRSDREFAASQMQSFTHANESQTASCLGGATVETNSVVADVKSKELRGRPE